jgi:hypothetical protein
MRIMANYKSFFFSVTNQHRTDAYAGLVRILPRPQGISSRTDLISHGTYPRQPMVDEISAGVLNLDIGGNHSNPSPLKMAYSRIRGN